MEVDSFVPSLLESLKEGSMLLLLLLGLLIKGEVAAVANFNEVDVGRGQEAQWGGGGGVYRPKRARGDDQEIRPHLVPDVVGDVRQEPLWDALAVDL